MANGAMQQPSCCFLRLRPSFKRNMLLVFLALLVITKLFYINYCPTCGLTLLRIDWRGLADGTFALKMRADVLSLFHSLDNFGVSMDNICWTCILKVVTLLATGVLPFTFQMLFSVSLDVIVDIG